MNSIGASEENTQSAFALSEDEVHIWEIALDHPVADPRELFNRVLSEDEKERALRLRLPDYRDRFVTARGHLRIILGRYLNIEPADITFEYNEYGKPCIPAEANLKKISFNLSHSRDLALCAVASKREVGIDVEYIRPVMRPLRILERFFSPGEREYYLSRPEAMRTRAFMSLWTIKEAYSKAVGRGFSSGLKDLDFSHDLVNAPHPHAPIRLEKPNGKWTILRFDPVHDYIAALAIKGEAVRISRLTADRVL